MATQSINCYLKNEDKRGFAHGNQARKPVNKHSDDFVRDIITIVKKKYLKSDGIYTIANFKHLVDLSFEFENISIDYSRLYRILMSKKIRSP